jgi:tRNA(Leu) C34 or U34 (ribose-2'-O)-methylase TrmL
MLCAVSAFAQDKAIDRNTAITLERYQECRNYKNCTARERWAIIEEMADEMHLTQFRDHNICHNFGYKNNCLAAQKKEREHRRKIHTHMRKKMRSMEPKNFLEKIAD